MLLGITADVSSADHLLTQVEERLLSPATLELLGSLMSDYEQQMFDTAGHGTWAPDDAVTLSEKSGGRVLVDTGDLMHALTGRAHTSGDSVELASTPYAKYLKAGARGAPVRDPAPDPPATEVDHWAHELLTFIVEGHRSMGGHL